MSNNGPRFQARHVDSHARSALGTADHAMVLDTSIKVSGGLAIASCCDIETAKIIARALNRDAMS